MDLSDIRRAELPMQVRLQPVSTVNPEKRTAELVWTTGARVLRYDFWSGDRYWEELSLEPGAVNMERLENGAPLLNTHSRFELGDVIGVVENARIESGQGLATVRFSKREDVEPIFQDVKDRIIRAISVGYVVSRYLKIDPPAGSNDFPTWRAISWTPQELSLVPIGADAGAQVRSAIPADQLEKIRTYPCEFVTPTSGKETTMNRPGPAPTEQQRQELQREQAELARLGALTEGAERRAEILSRALHAGLSAAEADRLVESGLPFSAVCRQIVDRIAERSAPPAPINPTRMDEGADPRFTRRALMAEMLFARVGGPAPSEPAREFRNHRLVDMARHALESHGVRTHGMTASELIERGLHTTGDFPYILENVANKVLMKGYSAYAGGIKVICKRVEARDFKPLSRLQFGEAPALQKVLEGGEYKHGTIRESKETYSVETFGRIFSLSRKSMINDDLGAFGQLAVKFGRAAAEFEHGQLAALLTSNPTMSDGGALFNATAVSTAGGHANLGTGGGSALGTGSLSTARAAMRLQKGLDGSTPIDATPKYLIVPAALETTGQQLIAQITPAEASKVNPFAGQLTLVVDPRLDANSTTAWYLAADSNLIDTIEYANLDEAPGPVILTEVGFEIDGMKFKVREDWGCGVTEWRGFYRANGA